jgi:putative ABC transport system permease protein
METVLHDLRYSLRMLRKSPGFTMLALLTLALGIGANAAVFSVVNALLFHPFSFPRLDQLMLVRESSPNQDADFDTDTFAAADFYDLKRDARSFQDLAASSFANLNIGDRNQVDGVEGAALSANFFAVLGVQPAMGRGFTAEEEQPGRDRVLIVSYGYWQRRFGGDPGLLGRTVQVNGRADTVVGIMPPGYAYPVGTEAWVPLAMGAAEKLDRVQPALSLVGRLRAGVSGRQAESELETQAARLQKQYPKTNSGRTMLSLPMRQEEYEYTAPIFLMLQAAAVFVLLLACANLGNLLLARLISRQKELAVRVALGATSSRVLRIVLAETMLLAVSAGAVATVVAFAGINLIRQSIPPGITKWVAGWQNIRLNPLVLGFIVALAIAVGAVLAVGASFRIGRLDPGRALKEGGERTASGRNRLRSALIVSQVAVAMVLLVGAGLMIKGFLHLVDVYSGLQPANVITMQVSLPDRSYPDDASINAFEQRMLEGISGLPGVQSAGIASNIPASNVDNGQVAFTVEGRPAFRETDLLSARRQMASAGYFPTLHIPVLEGRNFNDHDNSKAPAVALISQTMAARFWPRSDPIGLRFKLGTTQSAAPWLTVAGVVGDVKQNWFDPKPTPTIYLPYQQAPRNVVNVVVRTTQGLAGLTPAIRALVQRLDPQVAISEVQDMQGVISDSISPVRLMGLLMMVFGGVALALSAVGVYGVLAHAVEERMHEFGVRAALGARPRQLLRLVLGQALKLSAWGLAVALPVSLVLSRLMAAFLFGVVTLQAAVLVALAVLLVLVAVAASYVPARRATRVDPIVALRYE